MARPGLLFEEVAAAANKIVDEGHKPTIQRIREYLGNRGSTTTISRHLKTWKTEPKKFQPMQAGEKATPEVAQPEAEVPKTSPVASPPSSPSTKPSEKAFTYSTKPPERPEMKVRSTSADYSVEPLDGLGADQLKIKVLQLETALAKEQSQRESAERSERDMQEYAHRLKEEVGQRMDKMQQKFEQTINDLRDDAAKLKAQASTNLQTYQAALEKADSKLSKLTSQ